MKNFSPIAHDEVEIPGYPDHPISIEQLAEWAGVSRRFLEMEIERGRLTVRRLSKRLIRIMPQDVA
ncbi:MAG: hypothetical protein WAK31_09455, partial [Chthoniobacterales bacterium]